MPERKTAPRLLCWGEFLWDRFESEDHLGGAPSNVAVHLAALGARVALISRVGDDEAGRRARLRLAARGIDVSAVQIDPVRPTGIVEVDTSGLEPRYRIQRDHASLAIEVDTPAQTLLASGDLMCYGTLSQESAAGLAGWRDALRRAPHLRRFCDPNLRRNDPAPALLEELLRGATIVKINDAEERRLRALLGVPDTIAWLLASGTSLVALSLGPGGCTLITREEEVHHPGFPADPGGDNVGAGDAFVATVSFGLERGWPLARLAERANLYGSYVASRPGATPELPASLRAQILG
jgi:fructokinase